MFLSCFLTQWSFYISQTPYLLAKLTVKEGLTDPTFVCLALCSHHDAHWAPPGSAPGDCRRCHEEGTPAIAGPVLPRNPLRLVGVERLGRTGEGPSSLVVPLAACCVQKTGVFARCKKWLSEKYWMFARYFEVYIFWLWMKKHIGKISQRRTTLGQPELDAPKL